MQGHRVLCAVSAIALATVLAACGSPPAADRSSITRPAHHPRASSTPSTTGSPTTSGATQGGCRRGNPLANVYQPSRLSVVEDCITVTGIVASASEHTDGDIVVYLTLHTPNWWPLNENNDADADDSLVTEIVPADQAGCTPGEPPPLPPTAVTGPGYTYGTCTGADLTAPPVGTLVTETGPYVEDADEGWMEIHPVWKVTVVNPSPTSSSWSSLPQARGDRLAGHHGPLTRR